MELCHGGGVAEAVRVLLCPREMYSNFTTLPLAEATSA